MLRCSLTAKKRRGSAEVGWREVGFDIAARHQLEESAFVRGPIATTLLVVVEQFLSRCKQRLVAIGRTDEPFEEVRQVPRLCESSEL